MSLFFINYSCTVKFTREFHKTCSVPGVDSLKFWFPRQLWNKLRIQNTCIIHIFIYKMGKFPSQVWKCFTFGDAKTHLSLKMLHQFQTNKRKYILPGTLIFLDNRGAKVMTLSGTPKAHTAKGVKFPVIWQILKKNLKSWLSVHIQSLNIYQGAEVTTWEPKKRVLTQRISTMDYTLQGGQEDLNLRPQGTNKQLILVILQHHLDPRDPRFHSSKLPT